jgi:hypothetical protein
MIGDWGLGTGDRGLGIGDRGLGIGDWGSGIGDRGLGIGDWGSGTGDRVCKMMGGCGLGRSALIRPIRIIRVLFFPLRLCLSTSLR